MYARISIIETTNDEAKVTATFQGSADDAQVLFRLLNGQFQATEESGEVTEITVTADRRIPSSPSYEPIELA